jgi:hypothetical protein
MKHFRQLLRFSCLMISELKKQIRLYFKKRRDYIEREKRIILKHDIRIKLKKKVKKVRVVA